MQRVREILRQRADSEHEQAFIRLAICALVMSYVAVAMVNGRLGPAATPLFAVCGTFFLLASTLAVLIVARPQVSPARRLAGMVLDMSGLGASLYLLDAAGTALFPLYLWVIVGNGLRFGQPYLYTAMGLAFTSLVTVMATSVWWNSQPYLGAGLLVGLVALPVYFSALLRRLNQANQELEAMSRDLAQLAQQDPLTGLPNRRRFQDYLQAALAHVRRHHTGLALLFLDLDGFKQVNDTLGHQAGDQLLQQLSARLTACLRDEDLLSRQAPAGAGAAPGNTVARVGGDEFLFLLPGVRDASDAASVARRLLELLAQPFVIGASEFHVGGSIGISLYPSDGNDVETLIKSADMAMYHAKENGRNNYQYFDASMNAAAAERLALENALRSAIDNRELALHYQPKFDLRSGAIVGVEALLRWQHPELGVIPPDRFIPLAEESGLILAIGEWMIDAATRQLRRWQRDGIELSMSINISTVQLNAQNVADVMRKYIDKNGCRAERLEIELTESSMMDAHERATDTLDDLKALGVQISLDDFGVGYSSFRYLRKLPVDSVKIDHSMIPDITTDPDDAAIVSAILAMAHTLDLRVVAEGVETPEQLQFLRDRQCDIVQGYLFSRPLPEAELRQFIADRDTAVDESDPIGLLLTEVEV